MYSIPSPLIAADRQDVDLPFPLPWTLGGRFLAEELQVAPQLEDDGFLWFEKTSPTLG